MSCGGCRSAATIQAHTGSMNVNVNCCNRVGKSRELKSNVAEHVTSGQKAGTLFILCNKYLFSLGNLSTTVLSPKASTTAFKAASIHTAENVCSGRNTVQKSSEQVSCTFCTYSFHWSVARTHVGWLCTIPWDDSESLPGMITYNLRGEYKSLHGMNTCNLRGEYKSLHGTNIIAGDEYKSLYGTNAHHNAKPLPYLPCMWTKSLLWRGIGIEESRFICLFVVCSSVCSHCGNRRTIATRSAGASGRRIKLAVEGTSEFTAASPHSELESTNVDGSCSSIGWKKSGSLRSGSSSPNCWRRWSHLDASLEPFRKLSRCR